MIGPLARYARWLHTRWPAGEVEPLPVVRPDGATSVPGVYVAGDLRGIPLLKFALDSGARVARAVSEDRTLRAHGGEGALDLLILGAGVSGLAAAMEARARNLRFEVVESARPFATLVDFPRRKPIFTVPRSLEPAGPLRVSADVKEALVEELEAQVRAAGIPVTAARAERIERDGGLLRVTLSGAEPRLARRVLIALGRAGHYRTLDVPGASLPKVSHRLHDPGDHRGRAVLVVGGGDSAVEAAIALALSGAEVTLCHRGEALVRPKAENLERLERLRQGDVDGAAVEHPSDPWSVTAVAPDAIGRSTPGRVSLRLETRVREIRERDVVVATKGGRQETLPNDVVFAMIGREPALDLFRRSGLPLIGEMTPGRWTAFAAFTLFCVWLYAWKSGAPLPDALRPPFPGNLPGWLAAMGGAMAAAAADRTTLLGTLAVSAVQPAFWYTLAYSAIVTVFGVRRIQRRRTPYVSAQTWTLIAVQVLPLFLLPELLLPWLDANARLPAGLADALFPRADYGHGREFWRAYGLVLAFPLNVYNVFTPRPLPWWLAISAVQTLVLIPAAVWFFGKGAYCGWICSCGGLAETLGDTHRHKMPHGPGWNRLNLAGQGVLAIAVVLLVVRIAGWVLPPGNLADGVFYGWLAEPYKWTIDVFLAGVIGYGTYFWFSGRVWCRFFCPLAAWMHVIARVGRFRIFADKPRCISCGRCTAACHQGIDVMSFANKGAPMADPQCVRCSACVHACPTDVLRFGRIGSGGVISLDSLRASSLPPSER